MSKLATLLESRLREMAEVVKKAKAEADAAQNHYLSLKAQAEAYDVVLQAELKNSNGSAKESRAVKAAPVSKPVTVLATKKRAKVKPVVIKLFWDEKKPLRANTVFDKLKGHGFSKKSVWRTLSRLERRGVLRRLGYGTYELKNGENGNSQEIRKPQLYAGA